MYAKLGYARSTSSLDKVTDDVHNFEIYHFLVECIFEFFANMTTIISFLRQTVVF